MTGDRTTREDIVEELRGHADLLDDGSLSPADAADETRRLAREVEQDAPDWKQTRTDGSGAVQRARAFGAAGVNLTERAMGNVLLALTAVLWMAAGSTGLLSPTGWACLLGGIVTLAVGNRLKGWSS